MKHRFMGVRSRPSGSAGHGGDLLLKVFTQDDDRDVGEVHELLTEIGLVPSTNV